MKKVSTLFLVALFCLGIINTCKAAETYQVIYEGLACGLDCRSIPVCVATREIRVAALSGKPMGQYINSKGRKNINVTGYSMRNLFKTSLEVYSIKGEHEIVRITRTVISSTEICYTFDYK